MTATVARPELNRQSRVGVIDDRDDSAFGIELSLGEFCTPVRVPLTADLDDLLDYIGSNTDFAVFDHRLGNAPVAVKYTGAEATARSPVPAVLVSTFLDEDRAAIRGYQAKIPKVLTRDNEVLSPDLLHDALEIAAEEQAGRPVPERVPYRTVVRVVHVEPLVVPRAHVIVTAWRPDVEVTVPAQLITEPTGLNLASLQGRRFLADVNIYADTGTDLFFADFTEASDVPEGWMQAGLPASSDG